MTSAVAIARKELLDMRRNKFLIGALVFVLLAAIVSVIVAAGQFRVSFDEYNAYVAALSAQDAAAAPPAPQLFPLQLLRGSIEYLEILGALFAIILGYTAIARERQRATLQLIGTRPVGRFAIPAGKLMALGVAWAIAVLVIYSSVGVVVLNVGHATFSGLDLARIVIAAAMSWVYVMTWSALTLGLASLLGRPGAALIIALTLWLAVVLLLPQIGDTMDPDNQIPGGLFASLQVAKPAEQAVLAHFTAFDTARNALEVSSVTKHFERLSFAYLGIKDQFNQQSLSFVWSGIWNNVVSVWGAFLLALAFALSATTRKSLMKKFN